MEEKYAVLDPSLGTYKTDLTIEEARQAFESAIKNMFNSQPFTVNKCITNENGDVTWSKINLFDVNINVEVSANPTIVPVIEPVVEPIVEPIVEPAVEPTAEG
jgi:hypothetical protein